MAEIPLLSGGNWSMPMRAACPTRVVEVFRREVLRLMSEIPEMSDIIITVLSARRRRHLESRESSLVLIGEDVDRDVRQVRIRNPINHLEIVLLKMVSCSAQLKSPHALRRDDNI
jgi:thioredoxin reductase (NADPH)